MKTKDEKEKWLKPGERIDDLQCRGYDIIQNKDVFCFGMDAVLLADFATGAPNGEVIDLGTGTGVIPMLMQARGKGGHFTGLEVQAYSADSQTQCADERSGRGYLHCRRGYAAGA